MSRQGGDRGGHLDVEAVIYDLDGTLADTLEDIADAMERVLARHGLPGHSYDAYRLMIGRGLRNLAAEALPAQRRSGELVALVHAGMLEEYGAHPLVKTRLYPGVAELVGGLQDAGLRQAVLSNKADALTQRIVAGLFDDDVFTVVVGARPDLPLKPDPAAALLVAERLAAPPPRIAYLGDSDVDMLTAAAAGMLPVGAAWGFRSREELLASGARVVVEHPRRLLELLA